MTSITLYAEISDLRTTRDGGVILPGDPGYDQARAIFYGQYDRRPALIVRAANASDVSKTVLFARETGLELAVRGGGHSMAGHSSSEGGILLDLSAMKDIQIDPEGRTAWAQAGVTAGEYTSAAAAHGLATGFGDTGSVGIGGITLGGGVGYLVRKYGLTIDNLLAADIVTADGEFVRADADTNPDLFWAIRGGGGNFGVVTRFKFQLQPVPTIVGGMLMLPATADVIASFVAAAEAAPEELSAIINIMPAPPMPFVPAGQRGRLVLMAMLCYAGDVEAGQRAVAPFRALAEPIVDMLRPGSYAAMYPPEDEGEGFHPISTARSIFVDTVDRSVAQTILDHLNSSTAFMAAAQLRVLGGAMSRVPVEATAFAHRKSRVLTAVAAMYNNPGEKAAHEAWVSSFAAALQQGDSGVYVNFLGNEGEVRLHQAYPGATWERLAAVKAKYDPTNLFHRNHNIPPSK